MWVGGGGYFSMNQWQELELQALIFRHMVAGAAVPPELLRLVKKSLIHPPSYFLNTNYSYYHQPLCKQSYLLNYPSSYYYMFQRFKNKNTII